MIKKYKFKFNLKQLELFAKKLVRNLILSDIILLKGDLGSGKTTLARMIIKNFYLFNKISPPKIIPSPSFPILQTYQIKKFSIHHYDFFRLKNVNEILEMGFEENFENNISIIEWPEKILSMISKNKLIIIDLFILDENNRKLSISLRNKEINL